MENRSRYYCFALILFTITACSQIKNTPFPTETAPVTIPEPTLTVIPSKQALPPTPTKPVIPSPTWNRKDSRWYDFVTPITGDTLSSPVSFSGSTNMTPTNFTIYVTLLNGGLGLPLAQVPVKIQGEVNQPGTFSGVIFFSSYDGPGWITI